ncbi:snoaL-like polyketide cyclase family protein [Paraburkholderia fungorum]|uniref:SnoaL-like polyketide cyclase family protein n=1 Tax=Paraburkholderia fungorum TaxID=134537 RepID=A0AAU8SWM4_9BURK|nr:ester cyclase [Paraburkholderia fungorum]AJZ58292.1 snoaL-like polyketide cyclase family protein [Paraburkholderia fungorum]
MNNQKNIELIRRHFKNEVLGDSHAVLAEMTDDCFYYMFPVSNEAIKDKTNITDIHNTIVNSFANVYIKEEVIFATDEYGCAQVLLGGKHVGEWDGLLPSGKELVLHTVAIFKFRDGKIVSESIYFDRRELLRQLNIEETLTQR